MFSDTQTHPPVLKNFLLYLEQKDNEGRMRLNTVGHTLHLSEGGVLAELSCPVEAGLKPSFTLAMGSECIEGKARLKGLKQVSEHRYQVSLELDGRSKRARSRLAAFVHGTV